MLLEDRVLELSREELRYTLKGKPMLSLAVGEGFTIPQSHVLFCMNHVRARSTSEWVYILITWGVGRGNCEVPVGIRTAWSNFTMYRSSGNVFR